MKLIILFLIFFVTIYYYVYSNDGGFYSEGINIYPFDETTIELKKEILNLKIKLDTMYVDVYFEFYNPLNKTRSLLVGFVAPPPHGDFGIESDTDLIQDFKAELNGKQLNYTFHRVGVLDTSDYVDEDIPDPRNISYTFNVDFKPGLNIIRHSYKIKAGALVSNSLFSYILTTGTKWANKQIDDFTLNIDFEGTFYVVLPAGFNNGKTVDWIFHGNYKLHDKILYCDDISSYLSVYEDNKYDPGLILFKVKSGGAGFSCKNFKPENEINITTNHYEGNSILSFLDLLTDYTIKSDFLEKCKNIQNKYIEKCNVEYLNKNNFQFNKIEELTIKEIVLYKYLIYSEYDCPIEDLYYRDLFDQCFWYMPDERKKLKIDKYDQELLDDLEKSLKEKLNR